MLTKKRSWGLHLVVLAALVSLVGCAAMVAKGSAPPNEVMIDNQGYDTKQKGPVRLSHSKHIEEYKVACTQCHHEYEEGKNVWEKGDLVKKCADCHSPLKEEGVVLNRLKTAYHKQCCNCHIQVNVQGKEAPFEKCTECHLGLNG